ncbi:PREDICTED: X-linked retinitis pigmentosa GTPase regulator-like [Priapulus caudatus]|uniref:X-linked retinitis pigmentosa GTPase regulator-like n=1 Tax=Priapulus caudatus TaxID=37621 RepID=A0ABM1EZI7_PRICU|nr:PREDICTED: X-linked retinitis pigmentosa GTPase regulator-like [Priapulus caudatus]
MASGEDVEIPETGAVFTYGKSRFADNNPGKFWIRKDLVKQVTCGDEHTALITALKGNKVTQVCCGRSHTLVTTDNGVVHAFGANGDGQLGVGDTADRDAPTQITALRGALITALAGGAEHSAALTEEGEWSGGLREGLLEVTGLLYGGDH